MRFKIAAATGLSGGHRHFRKYTVHREPVDGATAVPYDGAPDIHSFPLPCSAIGMLSSFTTQQ